VTSDLFSTSIVHLIKHDGEVDYYPNALVQSKAQYYFDNLISHPSWAHDQFMMFGKPITTKRKIMWVGEQPFLYRYAGATKQAEPWPDTVLDIKQVVETLTQTTFNSCLLNLYHNGSESMGWHSDNEPELKKNGMIASVSLGAQRRFRFKHKATKQTASVVLESGSLLTMAGELQSHWQHALPVTKKIDTPRINLTFRSINQN